MLTTDDVKLLEEHFATKKDLKDMEDRLVSKEEFRELKAIVEKGFGFSKVSEEEELVHKQSHEDVNDRLTRIESTPTVAHELKLKN
jgi:hypothetical protein